MGSFRIMTPSSGALSPVYASAEEMFGDLEKRD